MIDYARLHLYRFFHMTFPLLLHCYYARSFLEREIQVKEVIKSQRDIVVISVIVHQRDIDVNISVSYPQISTLYYLSGSFEPAADETCESMNPIWVVTANYHDSQVSKLSLL